MTILYVGAGGSDAASGTSWANRKLTINGAEDKPVAAGDTVYVGPGVYRELLTVDVAGSSGNPITYIGDVTGEHTDGIGGVVRITGSNDDLTISRANCVSMANNRSFRTFRGFLLDSPSGNHLSLSASSSDLIVEDCVFLSGSSTAAAIIINGTSGNHRIRRCFFLVQGTSVQIIHTVTVSNTGTIIENCVSINGGAAIAFRVDRVGGITIKNCTLLASENAIRVQTALAVGQTLTVNNCIVHGANTALVTTTAAEFVENYNNVFGNTAPRSVVTAGANSVSYPNLFDIAPLLSGFLLPLKNMVGPSKWTQTARLAGTGESTDDLFGMTRPATSSKKSWGAIQYTGAIRETGTVQGGSSSLKLPDAGELFLMRVPVTAVSTTVSLYVYREANYAGTNPQMVIKQPGQSNRSTTDAGSSAAWNQLTDTFTPAASPGYIDIFLVSSNTATSGSYDVFVDTIAVS